MFVTLIKISIFIFVSLHFQESLEMVFSHISSFSSGYGS